MRELEVQLSRSLDKEELQALEQDVIAPLLDAQAHIAQLHVDMAQLKTTLMDDRGDQLLSQVRQHLRAKHRVLRGCHPGKFTAVRPLIRRCCWFN